MSSKSKCDGLYIALSPPYDNLFSWSFSEVDVRRRKLYEFETCKKPKNSMICIFRLKKVIVFLTDSNDNPQMLIYILSKVITSVFVVAQKNTRIAFPNLVYLWSHCCFLEATVKIF